MLRILPLALLVACGPAPVEDEEPTPAEQCCACLARNVPAGRAEGDVPYCVPDEQECVAILDAGDSLRVLDTSCVEDVCKASCADYQVTPRD